MTDTTGSTTEERRTAGAAAGKDTASRHMALRQAMAGLQRLISRRLKWEGFVYILALTAASLLAGTALLAIAPSLTWLRVPLLILWLVTLGAFFWWRTLNPLKQFETLYLTSRWFEARRPDFRNDISASLQFGDDWDTIQQDNTTSAALIGQLIASTEARVAENASDLIAAAPKAQTRAPFAVFGAVAAAFVLWATLTPGTLERGLRALFLNSSPTAIATGASVTQSAIVADIAIAYSFPQYSNLPPRTSFNSTGEIEALKGTSVTFEAVAIRPVQRAELLLHLAATDSEGGDTSREPQRLRLERRPGNRLVADFNLMESGSYTIVATLEDGTVVEDGVSRPLVAVPDELPGIAIIRPEAEVDVSPEDAVTLIYEASDDFGLSELTMITMLNGDDGNKQRKLLKSLDGEAATLIPGDSRKTNAPGERRQISGEHLLDLQPFALQPKDRLTVFLEVIDNDTITGPKVTTSEPIVLRVASPEDKHLQIIAEQEELVEALLTNLADFLENPIGDTFISRRGTSVVGIPPEWDPAELTRRFRIAIPPHTGAGKIVSAMTSLLSRMEQDPLMLKRDFELFKMTRDDLQTRFNDEKEQFVKLTPASENSRLRTDQLERLFDLRKLSIRSTEQGILRLEDLIASQRMENALETAKELQEAKDRLKELLEKYKETQDPALKAEIMRQMQRLRQRMMELMAKMQQQLKDLPEEHVNMEAFEKEGMMKQLNDASDTFDKIQEMLENGDIEGALKALEQMDQEIDAMLSEMQSSFEGMQPEGLSELDQKASEIMDEINDLQAQEEQLAKETDALAKEIEEAQREALEKKLEAFAEEQLKRLEELKKNLDDINAPKLLPQDLKGLKNAEDKAEKLKEALEQKDIAQALEEAKNLETALQRSDANLKVRGSYMPRTDPRHGSYKDAKSGIGKASPKASKIASDLEKMLQKAQQGNASPAQQGQMQQLGQKQGQIRDRLGQLQKKVQQLGGEFPMLQEQLGPGMQEAGQFMESAQQSLGENQGRRAHSSEKMALDKLGEMKQSLKQTLKKEKMGSRGRQVSQEPVEIPDEDRRAPREFREDLMDAMKEKSLDNYKSELQLYYESLVR